MRLLYYFFNYNYINNPFLSLACHMDKSKKKKERKTCLHYLIEKDQPVLYTFMLINKYKYLLNILKYVI